MDRVAKLNPASSRPSSRVEMATNVYYMESDSIIQVQRHGEEDVENVDSALLLVAAELLDSYWWAADDSNSMN
ncbi:hypothetical protein D8B26_002982 [Coccidioides posadasii str. Silveira]|nr:hypothetical protein D8B26_002982 [Coccidioides posadasii str. Silveira]